MKVPALVKTKASQHRGKSKGNPLPRAWLEREASLELPPEGDHDTKGADTGNDAEHGSNGGESAPVDDVVETEACGETHEENVPQDAEVMPDVTGGHVSVAVSRQRHLPILNTTPRDLSTERQAVARLPKYLCSTCSLSEACPEFSEGSVCAFDKSFSAYDTREMGDVLELMSEVVSTNKERWRFAMLSERLNGGKPDLNITRLSETVMRQAESLVKLHQEATKTTIKAEVDDGGGANSGLLSRLFGGQSPETPPPALPVLSSPAVVRPHASEMRGRRKDREVGKEAEKGGIVPKAGAFKKNTSRRGKSAI